MLPGEGSQGKGANQLIGALHGSRWQREHGDESDSGPGSRSANPIFPMLHAQVNSRQLSTEEFHYCAHSKDRILG